MYAKSKQETKTECKYLYNRAIIQAIPLLLDVVNLISSMVFYKMELYIKQEILEPKTGMILCEYTSTALLRFADVPMV